MTTTRSEWDDLALGKLTSVVGPQQGREVMDRAMASLGISSLTSAQDLYLFGQRVISEHGFAGTVGALLSTLAVMRGATPPGAPKRPSSGRPG